MASEATLPPRLHPLRASTTTTQSNTSPIKSEFHSQITSKLCSSSPLLCSVALLARGPSASQLIAELAPKCNCEVILSLPREAAESPRELRKCLISIDEVNKLSHLTCCLHQIHTLIIPSQHPLMASICCPESAHSLSHTLAAWISHIKCRRGEQPLLVVFCSEDPLATTPYLDHVLDDVLDIPPLSPQARVDYLEFYIRSSSLILHESLSVATLASLINLSTLDAIQSLVNDLPESSSVNPITLSTFKSTLASFLSSSAMTGSTNDTPVIPPLRTSSASTPLIIPGLAGTYKKIMRHLLPYTSPSHARKYTSLALHPSTGLLLHGPPGTGKTHICRQISASLGWNFVNIDLTQIVQMHISVGEQVLARVFENARRGGRWIVFLDEIDAGFREGMDALVNVLASEMDEIRKLWRRQSRRRFLDDNSNVSAADDGVLEDGIVVIGATNHLEMVARKLLRGGRFDTRIHVGLPSAASRREILDYHLEKVPCSPLVTFEFVDWLVTRTDDWTPAMLGELVRTAAEGAVRRVVGGSVCDEVVVEVADLEGAFDEM